MIICLQCQLIQPFLHCIVSEIDFSWMILVCNDNYLLYLSLTKLLDMQVTLIQARVLLMLIIK